MYCRAKNSQNKKSSISKFIWGQLPVESCVTPIAKNVGKGLRMIGLATDPYKLANR